MPTESPRNAARREAFCVVLPETPYEDALRLQLSISRSRAEGALDRDVFIFLEHSPVFTLGRRGGSRYITAPAEIFERAGIPVVRTDRGGTITYHGPGQIVMYPIVALKEAGLRVVEFVGLLEEVMIRAAARSGVVACRDVRNRGVWVGPSKLGSIGLSVKRGVTCHGLAFNVEPDLKPFSFIDPCGLNGVRMTSLSAELGGGVRVEDVLPPMISDVEELFNVRLLAAEAGILTSPLRPEDRTAGAGTETGVNREGAPGTTNGAEGECGV